MCGNLWGMLVFVDESGDTGLKLGQGSSDFFTVALVVFEENDEAQAADDRITLLRRELRKPADFEFHFKENSDSIRRTFLEAVVRYNFFYFGFVVNKTALYAESLPTTEVFYNYACGLIFESAKPYLDNALVKIDASGGRKFQRQLAAYLKTKINTSAGARQRISSVTANDSRRSNMLQLADMVCGAIARSYRTDKAEPGQFRKIIKHREISVQVLPE